MVGKLPIVEEEVIPEGFEMIHEPSIDQHVIEERGLDDLELGTEWDQD